MKIAYFDKQTEQLMFFSCKTDLTRLINVSDQTLLNWNKKSNVKETNKGIIYFDIKQIKAKRNVRNKGSFGVL